MNRFLSQCLLGTVLLCGCATIPPEPIPVPPLPVVQPSMDEIQGPATPVPSEERHQILDSEPAWIEGQPLPVAIKAAKLATMKPSLAGFDRGMLVYPYRPYAVYRVDVPVQGALHIQLQPGEVIRLIAGYRESDWTVQRDDAVSSQEISHVTVTPKKDHTYGRMLLITSRGVYYLDLFSQDGVGLYAVSWKHPQVAAR